MQDGALELVAVEATEFSSREVYPGRAYLWPTDAAHCSWEAIACIGAAVMLPAAEEMLLAMGTAAEAAAEAAAFAMAPAAATAMPSLAPTISTGVGIWSKDSVSFSFSIACQ